MTNLYLALNENRITAYDMANTNVGDERKMFVSVTCQGWVSRKVVSAYDLVNASLVYRAYDIVSTYDPSRYPPHTYTSIALYFL